MYTKMILPAFALLASLAISATADHNFRAIPGYQYSQFMLEGQNLVEEKDRCIDFSIRIMHSLAEYAAIYSKMSKFTPNIDNEAYHLLINLKDPQNGIDTQGLSKVMRNKVSDFVDSCVNLLSPPPIQAEENEFGFIPGYIYSKAMMEVRDMQPTNKCVNFSIKLMHHLADRKPEYALMSVYTPSIDQISAGVINKLQRKDGLRTDDMTEKFKNELLRFIGTCERQLPPFQG